MVNVSGRNLCLCFCEPEELSPPAHTIGLRYYRASDSRRGNAALGLLWFWFGFDFGLEAFTNYFHQILVTFNQR